MKFAEITCIRRSVNGLFSEKRFLSDWAVWRSLRIVLNDGAVDVQGCSGDPGS